MKHILIKKELLENINNISEECCGSDEISQSENEDDLNYFSENDHKFDNALMKRTNEIIDGF